MSRSCQTLDGMWERLTASNWKNRTATTTSIWTVKGKRHRNRPLLQPYFSPILIYTFLRRLWLLRSLHWQFFSGQETRSFDPLNVLVCRIGGTTTEASFLSVQNGLIRFVPTYAEDCGSFPTKARGERGWIHVYMYSEFLSKAGDSRCCAITPLYVTFRLI